MISTKTMLRYCFPTLDGPQPQVVEPVRLPLELLGDISQTGDACVVGQHHRGELMASVEAAILTSTVTSFSFDTVENISVNKLEQRPENYVTMFHGLILVSY
jgi:hypothetical protein